MNEDQTDAFEFAETVCGMSISYQGKALDTYSGSYHRAIADKSFVVMNEVAMQCSAPLEYQSYYFERVPDHIDYQCNAENSGR